jgi:acetylornithine/N-succinyldiaminopimelate aminotransferase
MNKAQIIKTEQEHYLPVFTRLPLVLERGEGCWVYDEAGNKYLDFLAGIAVNALGHGDKRLAAAIGRLAERLIHCSSLFYTEQQSALAGKLTAISGFDRVFFCNSGAEANEGVIKLARKYAYKNYKNKYKIISTHHSFHGRTLATLTATGAPKYQEGYAPLPPGFMYVDYGNIEALAAAMDEEVCAVLIEPIQGEGGVNMPPAGYLAAVRRLCDQHNALLIYDEIQTGIGRTGKWFAYQHDGVKPDIMSVAKGLGGGFPIGGLLADDKVARAFSPGDHGSTFGGNPLACAAGNAVLSAIESGRVLDNVVKMGGYFQEKLLGLQEKYPRLIKEVRGRGLLIGVELAMPGKAVVDACLEKKFILNCTAGNVLRLVPPLIVGQAEIDFALSVLAEVLAGQQAG